MRSRSRLNHAAAGLLSHFISRNNNVNQFWALGVLYSTVPDAPHIVKLDLKHAGAIPQTHIAASLATTYQLWLRKALGKLNVPWKTLQAAVVTLQFDADIPRPDTYGYLYGDPYVCVIELRSASGHSARYRAQGLCQRQDLVNNN